MGRSGVPELQRSAFIVCALGLALLLPGGAYAERLAVLAFGGDGSLDDAQLAFLADEVRSAALDTLDRAQWTVITRENMLVLLETNAEDLAACEGQCEVETGQLIGADVVVAGDLVKMGSQYRVRLKAYDTTSGELISSEKVESGDIDGVVDQLAHTCGKLFSPLPGARSRVDATPEDAFLDGGGDDWSMASSRRHVVYFESVPEGAEVSVDGRYTCVTPCSKALGEGRHDISLVLARYESVDETIDVDAIVTFQKVLSPKFGWLSVGTTPMDVQISLDGEVIGRTPLTRLEVAPGSHEVRIHDSGWIPDGQRVTVEKALVSRVELTARPRIGGLEVNATDDDGNDIARTVFLDGAKVGVTPWSGEVPVGEYEVSVGDARSTVRVREGEITSETLGLQRESEGLREERAVRQSTGGVPTSASVEDHDAQVSRRSAAPLPRGAQFVVGPYFAPLGGNPLNSELAVGGHIGVRIDGRHILEADIQAMPRSEDNHKGLARSVLQLSEGYLLESVDPQLSVMFRYRPTLLFGRLPGTDAWFGLEIAGSVGVVQTLVEMLTTDEAYNPTTYELDGTMQRYSNPVFAVGAAVGIKARVAAGVYLRVDLGATLGMDKELDFSDAMNADTNQTLIAGSNPNPFLNRLDCDNNSGAACTMGYELLVYRIGFGVDFCLPAGREGR